MLPSKPSSMMRRIQALMVILIVSGLAPATSMIGFCTKMPCCFGQAEEGPVLAIGMANCCTPINCEETPSQDLTVSAKAKVLTASTLAVLPAGAAIPTVSDARRIFVDLSPPPTTSERLSSLSAFLI